MTPVQCDAEPNPEKHWAALQTEWERRSRLAADWLQNDLVVADIGCGLMTLESFLAPGSRYIPMDVTPRDSRTVVFDLNKNRIPAVICGVAVLLGVLEYSEDIASVLQQLKQFPKVVFSYNHISFNDVLWALGLRVKRVTWRNRHTQRSLRRMLQTSGLTIVRERRLRLGEKLYEIRPIKGSSN